MAHYAQLDNSNKVINVVVVNNNVTFNDDGIEVEDLGINHLKSIYGNDTIWVQTSINDNIRKQYAAVGGSYDTSNDVFLMPKPFSSWTLNDTFDWEAPEPYPTDGEKYFWDEDNQDWVLP
jgi:hypothetical protein